MESSDLAGRAKGVFVEPVGLWSLAFEGGSVVVTYHARPDGSGFYSLDTLVGDALSLRSVTSGAPPLTPALELPSSIVMTCVRSAEERGLSGNNSGQPARVPAWLFKSNGAQLFARAHAADHCWKGTLTVEGQYDKTELRGPRTVPGPPALEPPREVLLWAAALLDDASARNGVLRLGTAEDLGLGPTAVDALVDGWIESRPESKSSDVLKERLSSGMRPTWTGVRADSVYASVGGVGGARSDKLSNVRVDLPTILGTSGAALSVAASVDPVSLVAGMLSVLAGLASSVRVSIDEREATVLWAMWVHRDENSSVPLADVLRHTNEERQQVQLPSLTEGEVEAALRTLEALRCIARRDTGTGPAVVVRERVVVQYA